MQEALSFLSVLNEQCQWQDENDLQTWFATVQGKEKVLLSQSCISSFVQALSSMRKLIYLSHFGKELDLSWLNGELAKARITLASDPRSLSSRTTNEPAISVLKVHMMAERRNSGKDSGKDCLGSGQGRESDDRELYALRDLLILRFAIELADFLDSGSKTFVQRCEGLFRDLNASSLSLAPEIDDNIEELWRKEIPVLLEKSLENNKEIQRCADLFGTGHKSRSKYCSDACRFSTFQIVKQLKDPKYLAEKQKRYRSKKK